ncbi:MAG: hypothetical protein Q9168_003760 [Polycauliona sp. 1 TL-2023]
MSAHIFPFLNLSGEVRNQIYLDIIGPKVPRPSGQCNAQHKTSLAIEFWPDRKFNTAFFYLNRQIHREFSDILWNTLGVEWQNNYFELDKKDSAKFMSMKRLQRCKLILGFQPWCEPRPRPPSEIENRLPNSCYYARRPIMTKTRAVELTVFGLAHKMNRMTELRELHLQYSGYEVDFEMDYFVGYRDGSIVRWSGDDLVIVFGNDLRGMKEVTISGTLCDECAALLASAMERPKEVLLDLDAEEPDKCVPRFTVPRWSDKQRGWI